jgi:putative heme iron utilization protein
MKNKPKKYLITTLGLFPSYRTFSTLSRLTKHERLMLKDKEAALFKADDGEIKSIYLNGKIK